ncbi:MAG: hypothetical protein V7L01_07825 [Nostoc sp.]|uniref:hypothetical protein n=1 Tax=Nostoc sp. TaxID=1180 RepID=UPI002FFAE28D
MTQTNCPHCDSTRLQYQENYGYWECLDCGHVWGIDQHDPDYDEDDEEVIELRYEPSGDLVYFEGCWIPFSMVRRWNGEN